MKKKFLSMIVLMSMVFSMFALNAGAKATVPKSLLVFGDSISTGYGLTDKSKSFGSLLAQKLGISGSYVNLAADGATSSDILSTVQNHTKEIAASDTVLLTAGGNDFLSILFSNIKTALGLSGDATDAQIKQALSSNSNAAALIAAQLQKTEVQAQFASAETVFTKNLSSIVAAIKAANPDAKLYIQTIYNPFDGVSGYESLSSITETVLSTINTAIKSGASGNYTVIDTYTAFKGKSLLLTNIAKLDIHPNEMGHEAIYELAYASVAGQQENTPVMTGTLEDGKFTISVSGLSSDVAQVNFLAVNTADKNDYLMGTAAVSGNAASVTFTVKGTDYRISATAVNSNLTESALTPIEVKEPDKTPPIVSGIDNNGVYDSDKTITFSDGTATLNGATFTSGATVSKEGAYTLIVTDAAGNTATVKFTINKTAPTVTGVENNGVYDSNKTITFSDGTATLNGAAFTSGMTVNKEGAYTLLVTDAAGNNTTVNFAIDESHPVIKARTSKNEIVKSGGYSATNVKVSTSSLFSVTKIAIRNGKVDKWPFDNTFSKDGDYVVIVKDQYNHFSKTIFIIDQTAPKIAVKSVTGGRAVTVTEANFLAETVTLNGKKIAWPIGGKFAKKGTYVVTVTDKAGHNVMRGFKI